MKKNNFDIWFSKIPKKHNDDVRYLVKDDSCLSRNIPAFIMLSSDESENSGSVACTDSRVENISADIHHLIKHTVCELTPDLMIVSIVYYDGSRTVIKYSRVTIDNLCFDILLNSCI